MACTVDTLLQEAMIWSKSKMLLNIQDPEPEMEDDIEVGTPIAGSDDEWAQGPASTSTSGSGFTVENDEDRRIRYTCFPLQECSDPEYWFRVNHFARQCFRFSRHVHQLG